MDDIYIVDDDDIFTNITELMIAKVAPDYNVHIFNSSIEGLAAVQKHPPAILFLDVYMPGLDGWDFIQQFDSDSTRIYLISSSIDQRDIDHAASIESVFDFISKPLTTSMLREILQGIKLV